MADVHELEVRSYNMSRIRSKDTGPEVMVRKHLFANGFRYRIHDKNLPGKPDITLKKYNSVVFIHGCFWHGHEHCRYFVVPKTRTQWWLDKINRNREKDRESIAELKKLGWNIITIWECELKKDERENTLKQLKQRIRDNY